MKERPILFSGEMVQAIIDGRKTMTRRVINQTPAGFRFDGFITDGTKDRGKAVFSPSENFQYDITGNIKVLCPYGQPGDRLWVRETWRVGAWDENDCAIKVDYRADGFSRQEWLYVPNEKYFEKLWIQSSLDADEKIGRNRDFSYTWEPGQSPCRWRPSIFMPRWVSRITLEITNIRVERLQDISEEDAFAEGIDDESEEYNRAEHFQLGGSQIQGGAPAIFTFIGLWDSINAKRGYSWESNPWVWVIEFRRVDQNEPRYVTREMAFQRQSQNMERTET